VAEARSAHEQTALQDRLRQAASDGARPGLIPRRAPGQPTPLSFAQWRLWFFDQLQPRSSLYNLSFAARLRFALDLNVFARALRTVVDRHEVLRTVFGAERGEPVQIVLDHAEIPISACDLRQLPLARRTQELERISARFQDEPFDLTRGPLLRVLIGWLGPGDYLLVIGAHHIVADGWSLGVLARELEASYHALARGREPQLPELEIQYGDFAAWQRGRLDGDLLARELGHWRERLADLPVVELPSDRPRPPVQLHRGADLTFEVPAELVERLGQVGRARGATLFMVLLAAFDVTLSRWAGQDDLAVGTPIANRTRSETENLIGFFVNTLVLRVDLGGAPTFLELLDRVRATALDAYAHQDLPFEKLVEELRPQRDLSRNPLVQVLFQLFEATTGQGAAALQGDTALPSRSSLFDLRVDLAPGRRGLAGRVEYDVDLFDRDTMARLADRYLRLLEQIVHDPSRPIDQLELLTANEHRLLAEWNATATPAPSRCVHELVSTHAELTPDAIAVVDADGEHRYGELEADADTLARRLIELGVAPGDVVGICLPRGALMVTALLAVSKAGAAFLSLDADLPPARLELMTEDSGSVLVLTTSELRRCVPASVRSLELDAADALVGGVVGLPVVGVSGVAWVVYTSGSSGLPKGVLGSHLGLANRVGWSLRVAPFAAGEVALWKTRLGFVDAIAEIFAPLAAGVPLVVADEHTVGDPRALARLIVSAGVTRLVAVPSLLAVLVEEAAGELARSRLVQVTSSGEPLAGELARRLRATLPRGCRIVNLYGSTEVAADATCYLVDGEIPDRIPIGRPLDNVCARVLGPHHELLPPGAIGELAIGGAGLSPGYIGHAAATGNERFIDDPLDPTNTLYQTGDLARWRADGQLECLGRADRQLKIRGVRVEPDEIEHVLTRHPNIREAAITTHTGPHGPELNAFLTTHQPPTTPDALRAYLRSHLPDQLIPTHLTILDQLPHLPNGKIDHTTLTQHTPAGAASARYEAPVTEEERVVADVFAELTGSEPVGRADDFFALGGHSLLATRAISRLGDRVRRTIPLRLLFEHPTVAELAAAVATLAAAPGEAPAPIAKLDRTRFRTGVEPPAAGDPDS
jgi:amino acid adenylation domain-containing protein